MSIYAQRIREALAASIDTRKLAETWQALHPTSVTKGGAAGRDLNPSSVLLSAAPGIPQPQARLAKALGPAVAAILARARDAIMAALRAVLGRLWAEGWALGQQAATAVLGGLEQVDWNGWTPGDYAAAEAIAGPGLRQLLDAADITIKSIAETRLEELAAVLEATLASDVTLRPPLPEPLPPMLSVSSLAAELEAVLDNPQNAELVAQAEIGRAQAEAARREYAEAGTTDIEISTAEDDKVCPVCEAAAKVGPHPLGTPPMVLLHPRCRCAELPVLAGAR